jgi:hypothetical protein
MADEKKDDTPKAEPKAKAKAKDEPEFVENERYGVKVSDD